MASFLSAWEGTCSGSGSSRGDAWVLVVGASSCRDAIKPQALTMLDCQLDLPLPKNSDRAAKLCALLRGER